MASNLDLASVADSNELACIHFSSWDSREISVKLGLSYLRRFYKSVSTSDDAFCCVYRHADQIIGYACGFTNYEKFNREFVTANRIFIGFRLFLAMLRGRVSFKEVFDLFDYSRVLEPLRDARYHLGALALRHDTKGSELGGRAIKAAINSVLTRLEEQGAKSYWGVCDAKNIPMVRYLEKLGFSVVDMPKFRTKSLAVFERDLE
jgi:hypothetical protein